MTSVRHWSFFFLPKRRTPEVTSDEYHRFLQFLILDLHKSEVGPSNISFFSFFFYFSGPFYPSTPGLKLCCH